MTKMPWVRFFPSDWLGGTRGMSAVETGVYITLIATMYERGAPIPEDHARLARLCGASNSAFKSALATLIDEGKISRVDAGLWNDRVEKEQVYLSEKSEVGSRAANARWGNKDNKNNGYDDANALPAQCQGNANQKPDTKLKEEPTGSSKKRATRLSEDWVLPSEWHDEAVQEGMHPARVLAEAERMKNWSIGSKTGVKLDWHATWRNWYRDKLPGNQHGTAPPQKITQANMWKQEAEDLGIIENDTSNSARLLGEGFQGISSESSAFARRFAIAGGR